MNGFNQITIVTWLATIVAGRSAAAQGRRFEITVSRATHAAPVTGRLVLVVSKVANREPRLAISPQGRAVFGIDLDQLEAGRPAVVDDSAIGYPMRLADLPSGDYSVQAVINVYEQVHRADGHSIWVHMNDGTIEPFNIAAGNLYSDVQRIHIADRGTFPVSVTNVVAPNTRAADTESLKP